MLAPPPAASRIFFAASLRCTVWKDLKCAVSFQTSTSASWHFSHLRKPSANGAAAAGPDAKVTASNTVPAATPLICYLPPLLPAREFVHTSGDDGTRNLQSDPDKRGRMNYCSIGGTP